MIVVLVGAHGAGKTSLGEALAAETGWTFYDEVGRRLAENPALRPSTCGAEEAQDAFDEAVFALEHARDLAREQLSARGRPCIIETWHPGNLAYARRRSPEVARRWEARLRAEIDWSQVFVLPVVASLATLSARKNERGDLGFFVSVGQEALSCARSLGARIVPEVHTDRATPRQLARRRATALVRIWDHKAHRRDLSAVPADPRQ